MSFLHDPGDVARTPLAAVLLEALNLRASGVLEVEHGGGTSRLWFRDGRPVGAQVFTGFRPLGLMLLQAGLIDIDALSGSLAAMAETRRPQGELLVEMGAVSREQVDRILAEQQASYFGLIAALEHGGFRFDPAVPIPEWTRGSKLSPLRTIVDALERPQAQALVVSALRPVSNAGVRLASGYAEVEAAFRWTDVERRLVSRLLKPVTLEGFFAEAGVPPERSRAILASLLLLGLVISAADKPIPTGETVIGLELPDDPEPPGMMAPALTPVPFATTVPTPTPTPAPVPGRLPAVTPPPVAPGRRSDPIEARARRQRLLQQAMRNMGVGPLTGGPRPPSATPPPRAVPALTPAPLPPQGGPEEQLRAALVVVAPRAKQKDFFARLGVPETAGRDDVKKAFLALARQFHPDRFASPALADLADMVSDFFTAVNEAYEVLSDDRRRAEYVAQRKGAPQAQADAARVDYQKAEACFRTRDFVRARGFYESAVRADPRPEYQAGLAMALLADPQHRDRTRARAILVEAVRDASCDRAHYAAGILARDEGDDGAAERCFRAAVAANPRNADAVRELRHLEGRRAERRGR
jgi:hypothetical protein